MHCLKTGKGLANYKLSYVKPKYIFYLEYYKLWRGNKEKRLRQILSYYAFSIWKLYKNLFGNND